MSFEIVCGLEIHAELSTATKIWCGCENAFGGEPNTRCCPVCTGLPGALPVLNRKVVEYAVKAGLAMHCAISPTSVMARKNYFYPDMPKAYQISQFEKPLCVGGYVDISTSKGPRRIGITRIHIEEDAGKLLHDAYGTGTLVDLNRCGVPLIEIVGEPDLRSAEETKAYMEAVREILESIGVSDVKMQEGSMRADVNVSIRPVGETRLGTRTEMKNLNSFRAVHRAVDAEAMRQEALLASGKKVVQETRQWDDNRGESRGMRGKEDAQDYRYFPEPDLLPILVAETDIALIAKELPELPAARRARYIGTLGIAEADAALITRTRAESSMFEDMLAQGVGVRAAVTWMVVEMFSRMNTSGLSVADLPFGGASLGRLVEMVETGKVNPGSARRILGVMMENGGEPAALAESLGLLAVSDAGGLKTAVVTALAQNAAAVADYRSGSAKALGFLMGQAMKAAGGRADPKLLSAALKEALDGAGNGEG
jgi:aspartyl-tRNA(Asn)/glutamyl-tRNA(Gln) amidotransferase subunit B